MKKLLVVLALLAVTSIASADITFGVDESEAWYGYMNIFNQADEFQFGWVEGTIDTASANWASLPLTMSPNTRLYDENASDSFWVDQVTGEAVLVAEFNYYQEVEGTIGETITFDFTTVTNNLPAGYEARGFIKVLDGFASWATTQYEWVDLSPGFSTISFIVADAGAGSEIVQAGFSIKGAYVAGTDPIAATGVDIVPEPMTIALLGLGGLFLRRRKRKA